MQRSNHASSSQPTSSPHSAVSREQQWLLALREANTEAFDALYGSLSEPLLRYAWALTRDQDAIYDIIQEAFLKLWQKRAELDPDLPIRAWMFRVVRNLAYKTHRTRRIRSEVALDIDPARGDTPESSYRGQELDHLIHRWVDEMPPRRREVFQLSRVGGLSHHEIAETLAISSKTVNNHLVEGLRFLRIKLRSHGFNEQNL
ncbi:MAG: sigma-70 family RNA polymerase sigma factor [Bacteroidota bacterium]